MKFYYVFCAERYRVPYGDDMQPVLRHTCETFEAELTDYEQHYRFVNVLIERLNDETKRVSQNGSGPIVECERVDGAAFFNIKNREYCLLLSQLPNIFARGLRDLQFAEIARSLE